MKQPSELCACGPRKTKAYTITTPVSEMHSSDAHFTAKCLHPQYTATSSLI